jgi:hypothetical protein
MGRVSRGAAIALACTLGSAAVAFAAQPPTNHGAAVSTAARATSARGKARGAAFSAVASSPGLAAWSAAKTRAAGEEAACP